MNLNQFWEKCKKNKKWIITVIFIPSACLLISLSYSYLGQISIEQQQQELMVQQQEMVERLDEAIELWNKNAESTNFQDYIIYERPPATATKPPTVVGGTILIDKNTFSIYHTIPISEDGYSITTRFKPLWNPDGEMHYLLDISNGSENNRVSLFTENNFLKLRIYQEDGTETTIKSRIDNWQNDNWYDIEIRWYKPAGNLFLDINGETVAASVLGKTEMNLDEVKLFLGSNMHGGNQAEGYFDYIIGQKFVYPEPTWGTWGAEQKAVTPTPTPTP